MLCIDLLVLTGTSTAVPGIYPAALFRVMAVRKCHSHSVLTEAEQKIVKRVAEERAYLSPTGAVQVAGSKRENWRHPFANVRDRQGKRFVFDYQAGIGKREGADLSVPTCVLPGVGRAARLFVMLRSDHWICGRRVRQCNTLYIGKRHEPYISESSVCRERAGEGNRRQVGRPEESLMD